MGMARSRASGRREVAVAALISLLAAAVLAVLILGFPSSDSDGESDLLARAAGFNRETIYRSPQRPGYTAWTGAWEMPDKSLMVAFTQATGPVDPSKRSRVPAAVLRRVGATALEPQRDFSGLNLSVKYLRSTDGGATWRPAREDRYNSPNAHSYTPQATLALADGTLIRRVNGFDLWEDESGPRTAYLQRLAPGADRWSPPQVLLDPARFTYQLSRLRRLKDGRIIGLGGVWETPAGSSIAAMSKAPARFLLMVSDDQGKTWKEGLTIPPEVSVFPNEWDAAELPNGDLLAVMRTRNPKDASVQVRMQATLRKDGDGWVMTDVRRAPFPHSGHPELLATREGPILHIATTGVHYTTNGGKRWRPLGFSTATRYKSKYYPRAVQAANGTIHVFGHVGSDDAYGAKDQSIVEDRFRLVTRKP